MSNLITDVKGIYIVLCPTFDLPPERADEVVKTLFYVLEKSNETYAKMQSIVSDSSKKHSLLIHKGLKKFLPHETPEEATYTALLEYTKNLGTELNIIDESLQIFRYSFDHDVPGVYIHCIVYFHV